MFPIRDNIPSETFPYVNYTIIVACVLVFLGQLADDPQNGMLVERYGMVPVRITQPRASIVIEESYWVGPLLAKRYRQIAEPAVPAVLTLLTCIFLHGGWMHLIGNMWFLYIFGDNVEDRLGHVRYLAFYCACGMVASLAHVAMYPGSSVPTIGASGAIAGVMGAYYLLYPRAQVLTLVPIIMYVTLVILPAPLFLGLWFLFQLLQGTTTSISGVEAGGVAWWAHIGGFVAGVFGGLIVRVTGWGRRKVIRYYPGTERFAVRRYNRWRF